MNINKFYIVLFLRIYIFSIKSSRCIFYIWITLTWGRCEDSSFADHKNRQRVYSHRPDFLIMWMNFGGIGHLVRYFLLSSIFTFTWTFSGYSASIDVSSNLSPQTWIYDLKRLRAPTLKQQFSRFIGLFRDITFINKPMVRHFAWQMHAEQVLFDRWKAKMVEMNYFAISFSTGCYFEAASSSWD